MMVKFPKEIPNFILVILTMANLYIKAEGVQNQDSHYDFEIRMVEHSIGVGVTMNFLMKHLQYHPSFALLLKHREFVQKRARQHDLSKFTQTPEFVNKYYPPDVQVSLGEIVFGFHGMDIYAKNSGLSPEQINKAKTAFNAINQIDETLLRELISDYSKSENLSLQTTQQLENEIRNFEMLADLLNRKMFENISRFRRNRFNQGHSTEVFEFGRPINLVNSNPQHWKNQLDLQIIAMRFFYSPTLWFLIATIEPEKVISLYRQSTKDSPFIDSSNKRQQEQSIQNYLALRQYSNQPKKLLRAIETRSSNINSCRKIYGL